jgi:protein-tyrosine phosphatase
MTKKLLQDLLKKSYDRVNELSFFEDYYLKHTTEKCSLALKHPEKNLENHWGYPFDHNLIPSAVSYINASPMPLGSHFYIAAQGPRKNTFNEFWEMIWNEDCSLIVTVTNESEPWKGREHLKFHKFWPEGDPLTHGPFEIGAHEELLLIEWKDGRQERLYHRKLCLSKGLEVKWVNHLQMQNWPDGGVIHPESLIALSKEIDRHKAGGKILVHCAAGIGRTGTVIAFHSLSHDIQAAIDQGSIVSIDPIMRVREMRNLRWGAVVADPDQYRLVLDALKLAFA